MNRKKGSTNSNPNNSNKNNNKNNNNKMKIKTNKSSKKSLKKEKSLKGVNLSKIILEGTLYKNGKSIKYLIQETNTTISLHITVTETNQKWVVYVPISENLEDLYNLWKIVPSATNKAFVATLVLSCTNLEFIGDLIVGARYDHIRFQEKCLEEIAKFVNSKTTKIQAAGRSYLTRNQLKLSSNDYNNNNNNNNYEYGYSGGNNNYNGNIDYYSDDNASISSNSKSQSKLKLKKSKSSKNKIIQNSQKKKTDNYTNINSNNYLISPSSSLLSSPSPLPIQPFNNIHTNINVNDNNNYNTNNNIFSPSEDILSPTQRSEQSDIQKITKEDLMIELLSVKQAVGEALVSFNSELLYLKDNIDHQNTSVVDSNREDYSRSSNISRSETDNQQIILKYENEITTLKGQMKEMLEQLKDVQKQLTQQTHKEVEQLKKEERKTIKDIKVSIDKSSPVRRKSSVSNFSPRKFSTKNIQQKPSQLQQSSTNSSKKGFEQQIEQKNQIQELTTPSSILNDSINSFNNFNEIVAPNSINSNINNNTNNNDSHNNNNNNNNNNSILNQSKLTPIKDLNPIFEKVSDTSIVQSEEIKQKILQPQKPSQEMSKRPRKTQKQDQINKKSQKSLEVQDIQELQDGETSKKSSSSTSKSIKSSKSERNKENSILNTHIKRKHENNIQNTLDDQLEMLSINNRQVSSLSSSFSELPIVENISTPQNEVKKIEVIDKWKKLKNCFLNMIYQNRKHNQKLSITFQIVSLLNIIPTTNDSILIHNTLELSIESKHIDLTIVTLNRILSKFKDIDQKKDLNTTSTSAELYQFIDDVFPDFSFFIVIINCFLNNYNIHLLCLDIIKFILIQSKSTTINEEFGSTGLGFNILSMINQHYDDSFDIQSLHFKVIDVCCYLVENTSKNVYRLGNQKCCELVVKFIEKYLSELSILKRISRFMLILVKESSTIGTRLGENKVSEVIMDGFKLNKENIDLLDVYVRILALLSANRNTTNQIRIGSVQNLNIFIDYLNTYSTKKQPIFTKLIYLLESLIKDNEIVLKLVISTSLLNVFYSVIQNYINIPYDNLTITCKILSKCCDYNELLTQLLEIDINSVIIIMINALSDGDLKAYAKKISQKLTITGNKEAKKSFRRTQTESSIESKNSLINENLTINEPFQKSLTISNDNNNNNINNEIEKKRKTITDSDKVIEKDKEKNMVNEESKVNESSNNLEQKYDIPSRPKDLSPRKSQKKDIDKIRSHRKLKSQSEINNNKHNENNEQNDEQNDNDNDNEINILTEASKPITASQRLTIMNKENEIESLKRRSSAINRIKKAFRKYKSNLNTKGKKLRSITLLQIVQSTNSTDVILESLKLSVEFNNLDLGIKSLNRIIEIIKMTKEKKINSPVIVQLIKFPFLITNALSLFSSDVNLILSSYEILTHLSYASGAIESYGKSDIFGISYNLLKKHIENETLCTIIMNFLLRLTYKSEYNSNSCATFIGYKILIEVLLKYLSSQTLFYKISKYCCYSIFNIPNNQNKFREATDNFGFIATLLQNSIVLANENYLELILQMIFNLCSLNNKVNENIIYSEKFLNIYFTIYNQFLIEFRFKLIKIISSLFVNYYSIKSNLRSEIINSIAKSDVMKFIKETLDIIHLKTLSDNSSKETIINFQECILLTVQFIKFLTSLNFLKPLFHQNHIISKIQENKYFIDKNLDPKTYKTLKLVISGIDGGTDENGNKEDSEVSREEV